MPLSAPYPSGELGDASPRIKLQQACEALLDRSLSVIDPLVQAWNGDAVRCAPRQLCDSA
jgi:uncharacterized protein YukE